MPCPTATAPSSRHLGRVEERLRDAFFRVAGYLRDASGGFDLRRSRHLATLSFKKATDGKCGGLHGLIGRVELRLCGKECGCCDGVLPLKPVRHRRVSSSAQARLAVTSTATIHDGDARRTSAVS
jgi:hypothetical protein